MRLDKFLVECGIGSRREVKELIKAKEVFVNGKPAKSPKDAVSETDDCIEFDGKQWKYQEFRYYVMNKKAGYVTALEDSRYPTVMYLLPEWVNRKDLVPVGRLDKDTEGLLLFTNDGKLNHSLLSPKKHVQKRYYVECATEISEEACKELEAGVDISGYQTLPAKVERVSETAIYLSIQEGKFHQVKRMMHAVGNELTYLKRVNFGNLELGDMELGEVREVSREDILKEG